jgi:hypothetical protein
MVATTSPAEPLNYEEAMNREDSDKWLKAAQEEMDSIYQAGTWTLVPLPSNRSAIGCKWVFKVKLKADNSIDRYKARLVAKGFSQIEGIDYVDTFSPVAKFCSIRALLALAAHHDLEIHQMDVKSAYLNGDLNEDIYMRQPPGFQVKGKEGLVCKLQKSLYGLKQAGRQWNSKIDSTLLSLSFTRLEADHCIYVYQDGQVVIFIILYVDDLILISNALSRLVALKRSLSQLYQMKDLGEAEYILGIQIVRDRANRTLHISQTGYIKTILERFGMADCKPASTPMDCGRKLSKADCPVTDTEREAVKVIPYQSAVGAIMYCMLGTRPDIAFAITALSQYSSNYGTKHWTAVKHLLRYLQGTQDYKLTYGLKKGDGDPVLFGYCDSDWGNDIDDRRSYTGYAFILAGGAVSWQSKKQPTTALSSVEAEYMAATQATKEAIWWRTLLSELGLVISGSTVLITDSKGSIDLAKNPEHHARTKHIDIRHHFIREKVADGTVKMSFVGTEHMGADILTKPLAKTRHHSLLKLLGIHSTV